MYYIICNIHNSFTCVTYLIAELSEKYSGTITSRAGHSSRQPIGSNPSCGMLEGCSIFHSSSLFLEVDRPI